MKEILKAAEQGDADAQNKLGFIYAKGRGVTQNYKQAFNWYTKSAEQGHAEAQCNLGVMYDRGSSVTQDYKLAYVWYSLAAAQGYENAIKNRDIVANRLLPQQLAEAQEIVEKMKHKGR